jgi:hypothetical protein
MVTGSKPCGSKNNTNKRISTTTNDHRGTSGVRVTMSKEAALRLKEAVTEVVISLNICEYL